MLFLVISESLFPTFLNVEKETSEAGFKLYPLSRTFLKLEILIDGHLSFA
jgi:hypothetical protein